MRFLHLGVIAALVSIAAPAHADEAPLAVSYVVSGQEVWLGNDSFEPEDSPARYPGTLDDLAKAFDVASRSFGRENQAGLITYDERASVRLRIGPITAVRAAAIGTQRDYYSRLGSNVAAGVALGLDELRTVKAQRKLLLVIGDGTDSDPATAPARFSALAERAAREGVMVRALIVKGALSDSTSPVCLLDRSCMTGGPGDLPGSVFGTIAEALMQPAPAAPAPVAVPPRGETTCCHASTWVQLLVGTSLVGLIVLTVRLTERRAPRAASGE